MTKVAPLPNLCQAGAVTGSAGCLVEVWLAGQVRLALGLAAKNGPFTLPAAQASCSPFRRPGR
jgi:hypothetical protein